MAPAHLKPPVLLPSAGTLFQSDCLRPAPSPSLPSCLETDPHFNFKEGKRKGKPVDWAFCTAKQIRGLPGTCSLCSEEGRAGRRERGGEGGEAPLSSTASEIQTCLWSAPCKFFFVHLPSLYPPCLTLWISILGTRIFSVPATVLIPEMCVMFPCSHAESGKPLPKQKPNPPPTGNQEKGSLQWSLV